MSDAKRPNRRNFGRRILTDNTAVFRLKDIESRLTDESIDAMVQRPQPEPAAPPAPPSAAFDVIADSVTDMSVEADPIRLNQGADVAVGGRVLSFFSAKGGVGSTSVAVEVASALTRLSKRVCLVDMDLQMGSAAYTLNMETLRSIANFASALRAGGDSVRDFPIAQHSSGIFVLDQPDLAEIEQLGSEGLPLVIRALKQMFDYVIVDGLRDFGDHALLSMDNADRIVMVTVEAVPALRAGIRALDLFRRLGYEAHRITVLMNRCDKPNPDFIAAVEDAYGRPIDWIIPTLDGLPECANTGKLLAEISPKSDGNLILENVARGLAGLPLVEPPSKGLFSRLFSRGG